MKTIMGMVIVMLFCVTVHADIVDPAQGLEFQVDGVGVSYDQYNSQIPTGYRRAMRSEVETMTMNIFNIPLIVSSLGATGVLPDRRYVRGMTDSVTFSSRVVDIIDRDEPAPDTVTAIFDVDKQTATADIGTYIVRSAVGIMSGFVTDQNNIPVPGAEVFYWIEAGVKSEVKISDVNGYYEFTNLPDRNYNVVGKAPGYLKCIRFGKLNQDKRWARELNLNMDLE